MKHPLISASPPNDVAPVLLRRAGVFSQWVGPRIAVGRRARFAAAAVSLACAAVLTIAALLKPDPRGYGTHQQLGGRAFAPCGTLLVTGYPCPTCGMTTAYAHFMHGQPIASFIAQPAGMVLCVATLAAMLISASIAISGRAPTVIGDRLRPVPLALGLSFFFIGAWVFKVAYGLLAGTLPAR